MILGIIGFSKYLQRSCVPYLLRHPEHTISAICEILDPAELLQRVKAAGITTPYQVFNDLDTMLSSSVVDAILVSTPHHHHGEQVRRCLLAGKHVMVDKPLACQYREASKLVELAEDQGLCLMVANQRRYESVYQYLKSTLSQGVIGEVRLINYLFANSPWYDYRQNWRGDPLLNGGGVLIDTGYLAIDMVSWLLNVPVQRIEAIASTSTGFQVEQSAILLGEMSNGTRLSLTITYEAPFPSVQEELSIYGEKGALFVRRFRPQRNSEPPLLIHQDRRGEIREVSFTQTPDNSKPLDDFLRCIQNGQVPISDAKSSLPTVQIIEMAYQSIKTGHSVDA